jgi:hypothetical protein
VDDEEERRWDEQRAIVRLLTRPVAENENNDDTLAASHLLARSLAAVVQDNEFWGKVRAADENLSGATAEQLKVLTQIPWVQVLNDCRYVPPPRAEDVANELLRDIGAVAKRRNDPALRYDTAAELRRELQRFVASLNGKLATPHGEQGSRWWHSLRHLAGAGLEALRHVNLASLSWAAAEATVTATVKALPPALLGMVTTGPIGFVVVVGAAAVAGAASAATGQLRQVNRQLHDEEIRAGRDAVLATMDGILDELKGSLMGFTAGKRRAASRGRRESWTPEQLTSAHIAIARKLETAVGALLPSAWVYCCAQRGYEGRKRIDAVVDSNARLHEAIATLQAGRAKANGLRAEVATAVKILSGDIQKLRKMFVAQVPTETAR